MKSFLYKLGWKLGASCIIAFASVGCAQEPPVAPVVPVQKVSIKAETFCEVMRKVNPKTGGYPVWDVTDGVETIESARRAEAAFKQRCTGKHSPTS